MIHRCWSDADLLSAQRNGPASVLAGPLWLIGSALLSWYLLHFGNCTATYGSLGAAVGLMTWMWLSAIIVLVGAELNSEIERQAVRGAGRLEA